MEYMSGGPTKVEFQGHRDIERDQRAVRAGIITAQQPLRRRGSQRRGW